MKTETQIRDFIKRIPTEVKSMTYDELVTACNEHFPHIPILPLRFENEPFFFGQYKFGGRNIVYRGRKITNLQNQPYPKVSDISFIPEDKLHLITEFGRANKKGESMFYGAIHYPTACFETLSKGIDFQKTGSGMLTVGTWVIEKPLLIAQLPISKKYWNLINEKTNFELVKHSNEKIDAVISEIKKLTASDIDYEILELFGDAFANFQIECEQDYYLSNYYKDRIFDKIKGFNVPVEYDGIFYASVPNAYESDNLVIKPESVISKMKFGDAMQVWVVHHKQTTGNVQFIPIEQRVRADDEGNLNWR